MRQPASPKFSELSAAARAELLAIWTATFDKPPAALRCGASNRAGASFCKECCAALGPAFTRASASGASQSTSPAASPPTIAVGASVEPENVPEGERKLVTALFADIKGSTELEENLDPEEARTIVDPALQLMIEAVRRYDGLGPLRTRLQVSAQRGLTKFVGRQAELEQMKHEPIRRTELLPAGTTSEGAVMAVELAFLEE